MPLAASQNQASELVRVAHLYDARSAKKEAADATWETDDYRTASRLNMIRNTEDFL